MTDIRSTLSVERLLAGLVPYKPETPPVGYYVYILSGPKPIGTFYVGKGIGYRGWSHFNSAAVCISRAIRDRTFEPSNAVMYEYMARQLLAGKHLYIQIIKDNLTEHAALALEKTEIAKRGRLITGTGFLFNLADGGAGVGHGFFDAKKAYQSGESVYRKRAEEKKNPEWSGFPRSRPSKHERLASKAAFGPPPPTKPRKDPVPPSQWRTKSRLQQAKERRGES